MGFNVKTFGIERRSCAKSASGAIWNMAYHFMLSAKFEANNSNEILTDTSGGGHRCMTPGSIRVDGDFFISAGWGDGVAVRQIADDGTLTQYYYDASPIGTRTAYNSLALDIPRKTAYISYYGQAGIGRLVFSSWTDTSPTYTLLTEAGHGLPADEAGGSYENGLEIVGDYLYIAPDDKTCTSQFRWNTQTGVSDNVTVINYRTAARYGWVWYDEEADRVYYIPRNNGEIWVTKNPGNATDHATDPATTYCLRIKDVNTSWGDDCYNKMCIKADNDPNKFWVSNYYSRFAKLDVTNILALTTGTASPVVSKIHPFVERSSIKSFPYIGGYNPVIKHPVHGDATPIVCPERNLGETFGWFDVENGLPVCAVTRSGATYWESGTEHRTPYTSESELYYGYSPGPVLIESNGASPTEYLLLSGYSGHGDSFRVYEKTAFDLVTSSYIIFGDFDLDASANARAIQLSGFKDNVFTPTGTTFAVHVTNDNGTTWEVYDYASEETHIFASTGSTVKVKMLMTGTTTKSSYVLSPTYPTITVLGESIEHSDINTNKPIKYGVKSV